MQTPSKLRYDPAANLGKPAASINDLRYETSYDVVMDWFGDALSTGLLSLNHGDPHCIADHLYVGTDDDGVVWFRGKDETLLALYYATVH